MPPGVGHPGLPDNLTYEGLADLVNTLGSAGGSAWFRFEACQERIREEYGLWDFEV